MRFTRGGLVREVAAWGNLGIFSSSNLQEFSIGVHKKIDGRFRGSNNIFLLGKALKFVAILQKYEFKIIKHMNNFEKI